MTPASPAADPRPDSAGLGSPGATGPLGLPGARRRRRAALLVTAGLLLLYLLPFLLPLPTEWKRHRWVDVLGDLAHVPLLGGLAWVLWRRGPLAGHAWRAAGAALGAGAAIEVLQSWVGRQLSLEDVALDAVGIALVLAAVQWRRDRAARWLALAALCLGVIGWRVALVGITWQAERDAAARFPLLADFEARDAGVLCRPALEGLRRIVARDDGAGRALVISGRGPYPGANLQGFPRDWTGYRRVEWDARAVGPDSLTFIAWLEDFRFRRDGASWLAGGFTAGPQWRHFVWEPVDALGVPPPRPLDRRDVHALTFFFPRPAASAELEIDNVRLVR